MTSINLSLHNDYVIFKVSELFRSHAKIGEDGYLYTSPDFDPQRHATIKGEVLSVPKNLSSKPIMLEKDHEGFPAYGCTNVQAFNLNLYPLYSQRRPSLFRIKDIIPQIEKGDTIYFHYNVLLNNENIIEEKSYVNLMGKLEKEYICRCRYDNIICALREGNMIMMSGRVLVEPCMETWDDILLPTYYPLEVTGGKKKKRPKKEWLAVKSRPEGKHLEGIVRYVGKNFKGCRTELRDGDRIVYRSDADWPVQIEGKTYFVMYQQHIMGVVDEDLEIKME